MKTSRPAPAGTGTGHPRAVRAAYYTFSVVIAVGLGAVIAGALSDYNRPLRITAQIGTTVVLLGLAGFFADSVLARFHRGPSGGDSA
ncbi:hypothetical protein Lfu02_49840 [Longispora fulva]|uniref:Uncharacterized protein n=1 Tax=Longispora fulva TaxID=619741 RepID=A0A8J7KHC8_9ACTN|nr:hypothetical protein [Longispora fulva]MBG6138360.1 hypothetical protein [Longispora fulva]GIG60612.1 hypothetical protein Lfu02_49840 [Longispora fulva]